MFDSKGNKTRNSERGVAFILVLMLVAAVSLFAVPLVIIGSTSLLASQHADQELLERYAADSGVEYAMWRIKYDPTLLEDEPTEYMTFNGLETEITIAPAPPPQNLEDPPLRPQVTKKAIAGYKTVSENWVEPCQTESCPKTFKYTLYFENYSLNTQKINLEAFGDCLPPGFEFRGVIDVGGFENDNWDDPILPGDMEPMDYVGGAFPYGPVGGELDDNPNQHANVFLSVIKNDPDPDHPCLAVDGLDRWQVKWELQSPKPEVPKRALPDVEGRGYIVLRVAIAGLDPGIY